MKAKQYLVLISRLSHLTDALFSKASYNACSTHDYLTTFNAMIRPFKQSLYRLCLALSLCACAIPSQAAEDHLDRIVAVVNDQVITQSQLTQEMTGLSQQMTANGEKVPPLAQFKQLALDNLIAKDLQLQAAKTVGLKMTDDKLNQSLTTIAEQHGLSLQQLPEALKHQGTTLEEFKKQIAAQILIQELQQKQLANSVKLDSKQVEALAKKIAANPQQYQKNTGPVYHFYDVLIPLAANAPEQEVNHAKAVLEAIGTQLNDGKSLTDALQASGMKDQVVASDLDWRNKTQLPDGFSQFIATLKPGQIAPPVRAPNGIHIVQLLAIKPAAVATTTITETHVRHILIKTDALTPDSTVERRLLNLRNDILYGGISFAQAATDNSQDPGSVALGGDLGWIKPGMLDPKFEKVMDGLSVNQISQPIKTPFGWHLIQVLGRRSVSDPQLAYQQQAQDILFNQKMTAAVKDFIDELKSQAYIKIYP